MGASHFNLNIEITHFITRSISHRRLRLAIREMSINVFRKKSICIYKKKTIRFQAKTVIIICYHAKKIYFTTLRHQSTYTYTHTHTHIHTLTYTHLHTLSTMVTSSLKYLSYLYLWIMTMSIIQKYENTHTGQFFKDFD